MKRLNLSGIYLFDQLEGDGKKKPTCIEDCNVETRHQWLESLDTEGLINTIDILCDTLHDIGNHYGIYRQ